MLRQNIHDDITLFFKARIERMMAEASGLSKIIGHPGLKGTFRELLLKELLEPLIPHTCRLTRGTVVGYDGTRRALGEIKTEDDDILIVDGECLPPFFEVGMEGIYPIESVLSRIEVKSKIDIAEVRRAVEGARNFATLVPQSRFGYSVAQPATLQILFGFESISSSPQQTFRYLQNALSEIATDNQSPITIFCVPEVGLWMWGQSYGHPTWLQCSDSTERFAETLTFIALLLEELPAIREARRKTTLSRYIRCLRENKLIPVDGE